MEEVSPSPPPPPPSHLLDPRTVAVIAAAAVFVGFLASGALVWTLNVAFGIWFSQLFVFLGLGWYVLRATGRDPVRYTGLSFPGLAPVAFGFALGAANFFAIAAPIQYVSQSVLPQSWREFYDAADIFRSQSTLEMAVIVAGVTVAAPVCEEFFFRGLFFQGLRAHGGPALRGLLVSAVLFSAFHLDPMGFVARVELGVLFGWLLVRTGSLWPAIFAHMANNLVSTGIFFVARHFESAQEPASGEDPRALLIVMVLGSGALYGLLGAARRFPSLMGPPRPPELLEAPEQPVRLEPPPRLLRLAAPWLLAAALSLVAYRTVDPLSVQLREIDKHYPLQNVPEDAPDALHAEREALLELRGRARRGEVPLGAYAQERKRQSQQQRTDVR